MSMRFNRRVFFVLVAMSFQSLSGEFVQKESVFERFIRYVKIDSQSDDNSQTVPTSENQREFAKVLLSELQSLKVSQLRLTDNGFVYALLPSNLPTDEKVEAFGLIAHLDTSPEISGKNVKPTIHHNYQGGDIVLPADPSQVITVADNPILNTMIGEDIITADGTTLLGADDKSGVAAIMTLVDILQNNPEIKHGDIAIAFTPDEETSMGIEHFDVSGFGAKIAYTVDGGQLGNITNETWHAREATVTFEGKSAHTGKAKGKMVNSSYAASYFISNVASPLRPENSSGRQGFIHADNAELTVQQSMVNLNLRDFTQSGLDEKSRLVEQWVQQAQAKFPQTKITLKITDNYKNMYEVLKHHPRLIDNALLAAKRAGVSASTTAARWGTDGSSLSFMGLPCPDIFTGGHNFHSKHEFVSRQGLEKTTQTLLHLSQVFAEQ